MPQQMKIDQFYKSTSGKQTSNAVRNIKKNAEAKSTPYSRNRKKFNNGRRNISFSQYSVQTDTMPECTIVYQTLGRTCNIDVVDIEENNELSQCKDDYSKESSKLVAGINHESCPLNETENTEAWNNNPTYSMTPKKILANPLSSTQLEGTVKREIEEESSSSIHLKETPTKKLRTPDKSALSPVDSNSTSASRKSNFSPKVASAKSKDAVKKLYRHIVDSEVVKQAIEYMNLAKQGAILPNNLDLNEIYSKGTFVFQYSSINTKALTKYEPNEITYTDDLKSQVLIATIFTVLSNPVNCGYFSEDELDFIYSIVTLPEKAQMLLARMIRRKNTLYRKSGIDYPEIEKNSDLRDTFEILASRSICTFDTENENLSSLLDLLQVDELQRLCRSMKIRSIGRKEELIAGLFKLSKKKSLFLGIKTPFSVLYTKIFEILEYCVRITDRTWHIVERILTLLIPNRDPKESIAEQLYNLFDVYRENIMFPKTHPNRFPIFSCQLHLITYIGVKSMLSATLQFIEKKNWEKVREYGNLAMDKLPDVLKGESLRMKNSALPTHVRRFMPGYIWLKILSKSIDAFKKDKDKNRAVEALNFLLEQDCHMRTRKGEWYIELALIKMFHFKDAEASALITKEALKTGNLTQVAKVDLIERANKILKKKTGVKLCTKMEINTVLNYHNYEIPMRENALNTIDALLMPGNTAGNKSTWCIESNNDSQSYGSVESLALYHYCEEEFLNGLHCEGRLPILLFATLFWDELYDIHIPGAFVTQYQSAPEDLFTEQFYENRKEKIDMKLQIINDLGSESLSSVMEERFKQYSQYQSIMPSDLLTSSVQLKEIVHCLGVQGVTGICKRLIENYRLWRSGFPDLIVWNYQTKTHKIVEVKGPKDTLSTKQRLWLEYLSQLGLNTEVCLVQDKYGAKRSKKTI